MSPEQPPAPTVANADCLRLSFALLSLVSALGSAVSRPSSRHLSTGFDNTIKHRRHPIKLQLCGNNVRTKAALLALGL